jgi:LDH2 family malate/lactate/ureidoglycolate dehydrogenase
VAAEFAMNLAVEKARLHGISLVGLVRSYHIGRLGEYSEMASEAGMIGLILAGGFGGTAGRGAAVAPFGGAQPVFSTNPISFGVPAGEQPPVMVDFATSAVAGGKISLARAKGEQLPPNSILDSQGRPTTDPEKFYDGGMMLPFGGHKGYGLAVVVELLGQALTGSEVWVNNGPGGETTYAGAGSLFIAIDPTVFRAFEGFAAAADRTIERIKAVPPAPGFQEVLLPGEPERSNTAKRQAEGITLADSTWEATQKLAEKYNVDIDSLLK